nr:hypothetical protein [Burkholderia gladioli]
MHRKHTLPCRKIAESDARRSQPEVICREVFNMTMSCRANLTGKGTADDDSRKAVAVIKRFRLLHPSILPPHLQQLDSTPGAYHSAITRTEKFLELL